MLQLNTSIATFLQMTRQLFYGAARKDFIKARILPFNIDDAALDAMKVIYQTAKKAESDKLKEYGEQLQASELFNLAYRESKEIFDMHKSECVKMKSDIGS